MNKEFECTEIPGKRIGLGEGFNAFADLLSSPGAVKTLRCRHPICKCSSFRQAWDCAHSEIGSKNPAPGDSASARQVGGDQIQAQQILSDAAAAIADRASARDLPDGERSMGLAVSIFNALTKRTTHHDIGRPLTEREGWLFMVCLKLARSQQGALRVDDYVDAAAYVALAFEAAKQESLL